MNEKIVSVVIPTHGQKILWLSIESLCNQVDAGQWELIIFEDNVRCKVKEIINEYRERLKSAGCFVIKYFYRENRISLSTKWKLCAQYMHKDSIGMLLQADDDYSDKNRIKRTKQLFRHSDWVQSRYGHFYNVTSDKSIVFDLKSGESQTGVSIAISKRIVEQLNDEQKWCGVDHWLYSEAKRIEPNLRVTTDESNDWETGFFTDGFNRVSKTRHEYYENVKAPFIKTNISINKLIDNNIIERLKNKS